MFRKLSSDPIYLVAVLPALLSATAQGHHAYTEFDQRRIVDVEGTLVTANWRNPHTVLEVQTQDENNQTVTWEIEGPPINHFRRNGVPLEIYEVGSTVTVAGWPSRRSDTRMYSTNILSEDGRESVLWTDQTRWNETAYGLGLDAPVVAESNDSADEPTLFRVWTSGYARPGIPDDMDAHPAALFMRVQFPLTESAIAARDAFDPVMQSAQVGCIPKGLPLIMVQPYPIEFTDQGDVIVLRMEEYDTVRTIHMNGSGTAPAETSLLGYSTGRWDSDTLVVNTSHVANQLMANNGVPLGDGATFVERFTVVEDGARLAYTVEITAPDTLTEPTTLGRSWIVTPGERVMPFECTDLYDGG